MLALAAGLCAGAALAQTAPQVDPHAAALQRCSAMAQQQPPVALALSAELLAQPGLPAPARAAALGCRALAQGVAGEGEATLATVEELMALTESEPMPPARRLDARLQAGGALMAVGAQTRALDMLEAVLTEARQRGEGSATLNALLGIAGFRASQLDDPEGALPYFEQALALIRSRGGPWMPPDAVAHYNYAYTLLVLRRYDEAEAGFAETLKIARPMPSMQGFVDRITSHRGEIQRATGHPDRARPLLASALQAQERSGDVHGQTVTLQRLARLDLEAGDVEAALVPAQRSLELAEAGRFAYEARDAMELLVTLHLAAGNGAEAARLAARIQEIQRGRERERTASQARLARLEAQAERDVAPGAAMSQDVSEARLLRNLALAALVLVLAGGGAAFWAMRRRQRQLRRLGRTDALTGLPDRREAVRRIAALFNAQPGQGERRGVLLLVEADRLATLNDRHGRAVGDQALVHLARCLRQACDAEDEVVRWGGTQFLVARAASSREGAFALAEHLRAHVARQPLVSAEAGTLALTVSIGVAPHPFFPVPHAAAGEGWVESLRLADRALLVARQAGADAWAGLWGLDEGRHVDLYSVRQNPEAALAQGWVSIGGNRPMSWAPVRDTGADPRRPAGPGPHPVDAPPRRQGGEPAR